MPRLVASESNDSQPPERNEYSNGYFNGNSNEKTGYDKNLKHKDNGVERKHSLREGDPEEILQHVSSTISDKSTEIDKHYFTRRRGSDASIGDESPPVIPNPISFNRRFLDRREKRYSDDEDEYNGHRTYTPSPMQTQEGFINENQSGSQSQAETTQELDHQDQNDELRDLSTSPDKRKNHRRKSSIGRFIGFKSFNDQRHRSNSLGSHGSAEARPIQMTEPDGRNRFRKRLTMFSMKSSKKSPLMIRKSTVAIDEIKLRQEREAGQRAQKVISSLALGTPSINLVASCLLEDDTGIARAPLLLSLLGLSVTDASSSVNTRIRKFIIDLDYGVGRQRLKWKVEKTAKDLLYLHSRFKFSARWKKETIGNKNSLPKYPIPPLKNRKKETNRNLGSNASMQSNNADDVGSLRSNVSNIMHHLRQHLSRASVVSSEHYASREERNAEYIENVEKYLKDLIQVVALKPQSNKLFRFFEISPISSLLCYETGYSGKQGEVHIGGTAKSQGWRVGHFKAADIKAMVSRRSEKWLLIRNSYIMYVSNINSTIPLDIFLVDPKFRINYKGEISLLDDEDEEYDDSSLKEKELAGVDQVGSSNKVFKHLKIYLENGERRLVLNPKSRREQKLWIKSLIDMKNSTIYSTENRFGSFAPVRQNCFAQWFVDGRDHFWAISSALEMAKDVIFIHDWWLSPELYLRRPAHGNQQWRLDRVLQRKAKQGVKIFVIIYRNVGSTVATDSLYTKHSLLFLDDDNIHVIRSPNQLLQNTYFWAHHEKLCIVDQTIAFVGGIDLCFGRYDTPDHSLTDELNIKLEPFGHEPKNLSEEFLKYQVFPGKDYSNPRVKDFFELDKPYESMYDRSEIPRMPWHDIHMMTGGKVARDLARHFVQRWNYLLRQKRPSRYTPLLTPPPDMTDEEVEELGLNGTCEVQLLRSAGNWSLGLKEREQSIQNAYLKLIEASEHFVYIENQFFITSCVVDGTVIHNRIGDALVERIIRAHDEKTAWKAIIVIPLMPGFEAQVDEQEGSSVRIIMQCQFMSISRGETSIFAKLRKYGIDPEDYIQFYSLRKWSRIGKDRTLVTEQLYIHAKTMIVDDRIALIGSANINERSMRGIRDSEVACVVRDNETILSTMNGEPYRVGKFPHSLRMRLMREHLGVNVDILDIVERRFQRFEDFASTPEGMMAATGQFKSKESCKLSAMVEIASRDILSLKEGTAKWHDFQKHHKKEDHAHMPQDEDDEEDDIKLPPPLDLTSFNHRTGAHEANKGIRDKKKHSYDARVQHNENKKKDVYGEGSDKYRSKLARKARLNSSKFLNDLAHKAMEENPTDAFIPDIDSVKEFLEGEDVDMFDEMDEASEKLINLRNTERWLLLKKISYLQRVAAKEKADFEAESKRRGVNLNQVNNLKTNSQKSSPTPQEESVTGTINVSNDNGKDPGANPFEDKKTEEMGEMDIPIVKLSEEEVREVIAGLNTGGINNFNKFIDPYKFNDPLVEEFADDSWYEHARKNTEIFRLIFHCQPDDLVGNWTEYKDYANLYRAFIASQKEEANYKRKQQNFDKDSPVDINDSDDSDGPLYSPGSHKRNSTISFPKDDSNIGLVGHIPNSEVIYEDEQESKDNNNNGTTTNESNDDNGNGSTIDKNNDDKNNDITNDDSKENDEDPSVVEELKFKNEAEVEIDKMLNIPKPIQNRRKRGGTISARRKAQLGRKVFQRDTAERILNEVQGHLVLFPTEWLLRELEGGNWFYNNDRIPPIEIYD